VLAQECVLAGGDDYELIFTAPPFRRAEIEATGKELAIVLTRIGVTVPGKPAAVLRDAAGKAIPLARGGFDHFA
jgi:thiamine-monophosphate kinase